MRRLLVMVVVAAALLAPAARAQIAPECKGVAVPSTYDEEVQSAGLQNGLAAPMILTPMAPIVGYAGPKAVLGLEVSAYVPLSCGARLAAGGTKTQLPAPGFGQLRPRFAAQLPSLAGVDSSFGFVLVPPLPTPFGTLLSAGAEAAVGWRSPWGIAVGGRAHMTFNRLLAEIDVTPVAGASAAEDLFYSTTLGLDAGVSAAIPWEPLAFMTPYAYLGVADVSTLLITGDGGVLVQNTTHPWWGPTAALGVRTLFFEDHLVVVAEGSAAFPIHWTAKTLIGFAW